MAGHQGLLSSDGASDTETTGFDPDVNHSLQSAQGNRI